MSEDILNELSVEETQKIIKKLQNIVINLIMYKNDLPKNKFEVSECELKYLVNKIENIKQEIFKYYYDDLYCVYNTDIRKVILDLIYCVINHIRDIEKYLK